ncbi:TetR/AcrR family transcriptional regulator [Pseudonocardia kujensis]|uniref:TetR/AcrR family transcriptional regulator n=1 Tax=Pseudonocardia kujensis TaxID=1128675 RepID=UPI001E5867AD|nr:TetR/AcrR family transcriptional regulator [Pseudonocardia kujensis]MCE0763331.1 TetR/AcrR family transcriptional regulator [Pseudonocardia kujensis]
MSTEPEDEGLTPGARRILEVASELFYRRGFHAVGVDTIAAESGVTKRTLYDRFRSKDALVAAYLSARDRQWRDVVLSRLDDAGADRVARVLAPFDALPEWLDAGGRGCAFINAYAEFPDPDHPAHQLVVAEKSWLRDLFHALVVEVGAIDPGTLGEQLLCLHEGAIVSHAILGQTSSASTARSAAEILVCRAL